MKSLERSGVDELNLQRCKTIQQSVIQGFTESLRDDSGGKKKQKEIEATHSDLVLAQEEMSIPASNGVHRLAESPAQHPKNNELAQLEKDRNGKQEKERKKEVRSFRTKRSSPVPTWSFFLSVGKRRATEQENDRAISSLRKAFLRKRERERRERKRKRQRRREVISPTPSVLFDFFGRGEKDRRGYRKET